MLKKVTLVIGLVLFALFLREVSPNDLKSANLLSARLIVFVVAINGLALFLKAWRWHLLLLEFNVRLPRSALIRSVSSGFFLGLVSPGTAGEFGRVVNVPLEKSHGLSTIMLEKVADIGVLCCFSAVGVAFLLFPDANDALSLAVSFFLLCAMTVAIISAGRLFVAGRLVRIVCDRLRIDGIQLEHALLTLQKTRIVVLCVLVSVALWVIPGVQYYMICKALNIGITFQHLMVSFYGPYLLGVISMIPLGFGVFDFGAARMIQSLGVGGEMINTGVVLFRSLSTLPLVLFGFICFLYSMMKKNSTEPT